MVDEKNREIARQEVVMAFLDRLAAACAELAESSKDPWRSKVVAAVREKDAISTAALLDLLRVPATTGTARRLAAVMRSLNFVPLKSRRLMPGGRAGNTVTRGWTRPLRENKITLNDKNASVAGLEHRQQGIILHEVLTFEKLRSLRNRQR